jgi:two-component system nitrogen regulation sensor histidine kinase NtrY
MTSVDEVAVADASLAGPSARRLAYRILGPAAVAGALLSALVAFVILTGLTPIVLTQQVVMWVLIGNALAVFVLLLIIANEVLKVVQARRRGRAASRLHVRIVTMFSIIAAVPAILVSVLASVTLDRGLDHWFSGRTRAAIENSLLVARAYTREHVGMVRIESLGMATDLARAKPLFDQDRERFRQFLTTQTRVRELSAVRLIGPDFSEIDRDDLGFNRPLRVLSPDALAQINETEPVVGVVPNTDYVVSIIKLRNFENTWLYVARALNPVVLQQLQMTEESVAEYASLEAGRFGVQVAYALMYTVVALIVLLSAVWIGLNFASWLVSPIRRLIGAANLVSTGNLHVRVPVRHSEGDLAHLGETFNNMTQELRTQRDDLMHARDTMDSRRRFTEAVLAGASAGVIGIDHDGCISILNRSAEKLIGCTESEALGAPLARIVPELAALLGEARSGKQRLLQRQITIQRGGRERNLSVRFTTESSDSNQGYVITLDDITDLVIAQRSSAWADIARRIAHEIKNPLTPIQLSAERLKRKYGHVIKEDRHVFEQCTDTIVRQVDDIKRMVDEFSRFARMPKPVMATENIADLVRQVAFLMRVGHPDIDIDIEASEDPLPAKLDRRLISQALTNIIKNATEAVAAVPENIRGRGRIRVRASREGENVAIDVIDNGTGLPKENRNRLLEPYVTTREKGTGLGLAIVGKILEEHGGKIELFDAPEVATGGRGACVRLSFATAGLAAKDGQGNGSDASVAAAPELGSVLSGG